MDMLLGKRFSTNNSAISAVIIGAIKPLTLLEPHGSFTFRFLGFLLSGLAVRV